MSGPVSGALPLWLNNEKWIIKDGWLTNPGPMTLRIDKDTADAVVKDNVTAGSAINWLRYMEITHSWTKINVDNLGVLTMQAAITGKSRVDGKTAIVNLNYTHEENVFYAVAQFAFLATIYRHGLNKIQRCRNLLAGKTRTVRINNENEYCHAVSACVIYRGGVHATY
ncbi:DctA-YdbH Dicarboxylate transport [Salmonella enterica subsp. enterica]|nr:DctA-YdbH Dicarboxylate transport [Salmonella enterica subsp. enterica]